MEESHRVNLNNMIGGIKTDEGQKKPRVLHDQHRLPSPVVPRPISSAMEYYGNRKAEVFSVFVGGINEKISALCGKILIVDGDDIFSIYNRDESCAEVLPDSGLITIEVNYHAIHDCDLNINLNLSDPIGKLKVSRGCLSCDLSNLKSSKVDNTQLCSVVRGDDGYAAVHYGVFDDAFEAFLEVKLFAIGDFDVPVSLYVSLIACYGGHDYSTDYKKKYFKSRLFDCPRDKMVELKAGSGIAMLKSIVVVPAMSSLIIEANLRAFGINGIDESVNGKAEFEIDMCGATSEKICGQNYWIEIYAKFKN